MSRILYRVVRNWPPSHEDFVSNAEKGLKPRGPERARPELRSGLSMFDTPDAARAIARRLPFPGLICEMEISDTAPARVEKTLGPGHYTVWATAETLLRCARRVL